MLRINGAPGCLREACRDGRRTITNYVNLKEIWKWFRENEIAREGGDDFRGKRGEDSDLRESREQKLKREKRKTPLMFCMNEEPGLLLGTSRAEQKNECLRKRGLPIDELMATIELSVF